MAELANSAELNEWMYSLNSDYASDILHDLEPGIELDFGSEELSEFGSNAQLCVTGEMSESQDFLDCFRFSDSSLTGISIMKHEIDDVDSDCGSRNENSDDNDCNSFRRFSLNSPTDIIPARKTDFKQRTNRKTLKKIGGVENFDVINSSNEASHDGCHEVERRKPTLRLSQSAKRNRLCMSKNAVIARENRTKKKQYEETLKTAVTQLLNENAVLKQQFQEKEDVVHSLSNEVVYLRSVLANSTMLSRLLHNIPNCLSNPLADDNSTIDNSLLYNGDSIRPDDVYVDPVDSVHDTIRTEHNYAGPWSSSGVKDAQLSAGVCLHVATNRVSLELCTTCNENVQQRVAFG